MNWAWASSFDQIWRSAAFPMWMTLAAAGFFGLILLITLLRAEKSVANGALTVITLLSIAIAGAAMVRVYGPGAEDAHSKSAKDSETSHRRRVGNDLGTRSQVPLEVARSLLGRGRHS